jgi:hypothetical protein
MPDPHEDLRATEESIRYDADHLISLEDEKAALDPADPLVHNLSEQVERVAAGVQAKAGAERELSEEIQAIE